MISVIVPVYNVEKYLDRCIESIVQQTYRNLEIILVDDGSTDSSGDICDKWAMLDNRIKVIHQTNGGVSRARNVGIQNVTGNFILFVDSDDYLQKEMCESLCDMLKSTNADMSVCKAHVVYGDATESRTTASNHIVTCCNRDEAAFKLFSVLDNALWNKLFKCNLVAGILFEEGRTFGEDPFYLAQALNKANKVAFSTAELYVHRLRAGSITRSKFSTQRFDEIYFKDKMHDYFKINFPALTRFSAKWRFLARMNVCRSILSASLQQQYQLEFDDIKNELQRVYLQAKCHLSLKSRIEYHLFSLCPKLYKKILSFI